MKNKLNAFVVLSAFAITTTAFAQKKTPDFANYKQQNMLLAKKNLSSKPARITFSNDYSTNPLVNHRNYKVQLSEPQSKVLIVGVNSDDKFKNYKQKNLLTKNGYEVKFGSKPKLDTTTMIGE
ncbi:hypothetical protein EMA8858_00178 [Emticicia aquatica]|uniref:Uncharacterized protein n=1 Tax=Emticicia aquatica TaxID=1681835 RepID=A0ABN8EQ93_9BACT|nr:hypothetical protein [Emticicia aquatica]CAH0994071.1 hypothetical protein EMA8858_00178 [Emticicia aquatica]